MFITMNDQVMKVSFTHRKRNLLDVMSWMAGHGLHQIRIILLLLAFMVTGQAQAAISFVAVNSNGVNNSTIQLFVDAGTSAGNLLVAQVAVRGVGCASITAPAGWTLVRCDASGTTVAQAVYWKVATSADIAQSFSWGFGSNRRAAGAIAVYDGVDTSAPVDTHAGQANASSSSATAPGVTTSFADDMLVAMYAAASSSVSIAAPAGMTEEYQDSSGGTGVSASLSDAVFASAGATGNKVAALGSSQISVGQLLALKAAPVVVPNPYAEWRMDENLWNSTANEVVDNSGNGFHARAFNSANTTDVTRAIPGTPGTCRYGVFDNGTTITQGYLQTSVPNLTTNFTITAWIRSTSASTTGQRILIDDQNNSGGYGFSLGDGGSNVLRFYSRNIDPIILDSTYAIANNTWYFVAAVANTTTKRRTIYVFNAAGTLLNSTSDGAAYSGTWGTDAGPVSIGGETNASGESPSGFHFKGNLDEVRVYNSALSQAVLTEIASQSHACVTGPDHYELSIPSNAVACAPAAVTVTACADASSPCTNKLTTLSGQTATLSNSAGTLAASALTFDAIGSVGTTLSHPSAADGSTATVTLTSTSTPAVNATKCCLDGASCVVSSSCSTTFKTAGFLFSDVANGVAATIPAQVAGTTSPVYYLRAVKTNTTTKACEAALAGATNVDFGYECNNPSTCSASNLMSINGGVSTTVARNNNGAVSSYLPVGMTFDAAGNAPFTFNFGDVGQVRLHARKLASGSLLSSLTGTSNAFVEAPAAFSFSAVTAAPIKAGNAFSATVTARSSAGAATPNFGKESTAEGVTLNFNKCQPTGAGAVNGTFSGSVGAFTNGVGVAGNLSWSEVGNGDLVATLTSASYLGSGLTAGGNTGTAGTVCNGAGNVGRFIPDHFDTVVSDACGAGIFTYSGQAFSTQVTARNLSGGKTSNYDGSANTTPNFSKAVTLSDASGVIGAMTTSAVSAASFTAGVANASPVFAYTNVLTAPSSIRLRATDVDGVVSSTTEGLAHIRSGRARLASQYGSELLDLALPFQTQYWDGSAWLLNAADICTTGVSLALTDPAPADGLSTAEVCVWDTGSPGNSGLGCVAAGTVANRFREPPTAGAGGLFNLNLRAPGAGNTGSMNVTATVPDFLRFDWTGAGKTSPTARATFGLRRMPIIYLRESFF